MSNVKSNREGMILDTAISLLAAKGVAGLTHRALDEAASLPQGSTSYYFARKADLLGGVAQQLAAHLTESCRQIRQDFADKVAEGDMIAARVLVADDLVHTVSEEREILLARLEIGLFAMRNESIRPAADALEKAARDPIAFFLKLLNGTDDPIDTDRQLALLDGLALRHFMGHTPKPTRSQIEAILAFK